MTIAVLGTGIMGAPFARHLAAGGMQVRAWNRTPEKAQPLVEHHVEVAGSPAEAAAGADLVLTMLADGPAVEAVMTDGGALQAMADDGVWLQMSTVGIAATERLAELAAQRGVGYVDAPVAGTRGPAEQGQVLVLASGAPELRERAQPVFDAIGRETRWLGEQPGDATRMKLVLNAWLVSLVEGVAETIAFARGIGLDPAHFLEAIDGSPMGSEYAQLKGRPMVSEDFGETAFPLGLAAKDARLVVEAAEAHDLALPVLRAVADQFDRAAGDGHHREDMAAVYWASRAG